VAFRRALRCLILRSRRHSSAKTSASGRVVIGSPQTVQGPRRERVRLLSTPLSVVALEVVGVLGPPFTHRFGVTATTPAVEAACVVRVGPESIGREPLPTRTAPLAVHAQLGADLCRKEQIYQITVATAKGLTRASAVPRIAWTSDSSRGANEQVSSGGSGRFPHGGPRRRDPDVGRGSAGAGRQGHAGGAVRAPRRGDGQGHSALFRHVE
jgi:hypothetical protein